MRTEVIRDWSGFMALEGEWNSLLSRSHADTIFLTWEWIRSWVEVVGRSVPPLLIVVRDADGILAGLVPFYVGKLRLVGLVRYRTLRMMGDYATGAEYPDWIVRKDCEALATQAIAHTLAVLRKDWDCIWLPNVAGWTGARERILQACQEEGFHCHVRPRDFAFLELPADFETYRAALSQNKRKQLHRELKRIMRRTGIAVTRCETAEQLPRFLEALFELHHRRWSQKGKEGIFRRKPSEARFYRQFTRVAVERRWLRLFGFEEHGEFKAVQIGYVYKDVFYQLQEGFEPDYMAGVGNVLRSKVVEDCIAGGVKAIDFLGDMSEHKRRWLAKERMGYDLFIGHRSLKNRLPFYVEVWPSGRFLRPSGLPGSGDAEKLRRQTARERAL